VRLFEQLIDGCTHLGVVAVGGESVFSRERLYNWRKGVEERKAREKKLLPERTVENAAAVVASYPHLGGRKAQAYMIYHNLGVIGMKGYDAIKRNVKRLLQQELSARPRDERADESYEHIRPGSPGEVWAEDFTELPVAGEVFRVAVVVDVFDHYFLGWSCAHRATATFVGQPVAAAVTANFGQGPKQILLSDNGTQYISEEHGELLDSAEIVHRLIPACVPQYNGTVESEMTQIKSMFYNVWERCQRNGADGKEKSLCTRVEAALAETFHVLNEDMPRPFLGGITPADVHFGRQQAVKTRLEETVEVARRQTKVPPWKRKYWEVLNNAARVFEMSTRELQTKLAFFGRRPLRRIAKLNLECVG
jgi:transposase InsO family protein